MANSVTTTPGPLGLAHLYFYALNFLEGREGSLCDPIELYADVLMILTHGGRARIQSTYWAQCSGTTDSVTEEALTVVRSAIAGEMPSWFADTYNDSDGDPELERVWANVKAIANSKRRAVIVFQLRDLFGGYCENQKATESAFANGDTRNPWSDGGCVPDAPARVSATAVGNGRLAVSWQAPPDDGGSPIEGYMVQWKSGTQEYDSSRQATVTNLADLRRTISGLTNDESYTLQILAYNHNGDGAATEVTATPTATDSTAPALLAARVDGAVLRLAWNEALDTSSEPATTAFTVNVGGVARATDEVEVLGSVVTLSLESAVNVGDSVTVGYSAPIGPGAMPLRDSAENNVESFSAQMVRNDATRAAFTSDPGPDMTYVFRNGLRGQDVTEATVTFSEPVVVSGRPELALLIGRETRHATYRSGSGTNSLVFRYVLAGGETDADGISVPSGAISTDAGLIRYASTKAVAPAQVVLGPQGGHLVDAVRPTLVRAKALANGNDVTLTWDKALDEDSMADLNSSAGFQVKDTSDDTYRDITSMSVLGNVVTLTLSSAISANDHSLTVSYKWPYIIYDDVAYSSTMKDTVGNWAGVISDEVSITRPNSPPEFPSYEDGARSVDENTPANRNIGTPIAADDADHHRLIYSISGADAAFFDVVASSGQLRTKGALDREFRGSYSFTLSVHDQLDIWHLLDPTVDVTISVTVTVVEVDEPPEISGTTTIGDYDENGSGDVAAYTASDPEGDSNISWSLGGTDQADFTISDGVLKFASAPDYERPEDSGGNNQYEVTVQATDSNNKRGELHVDVIVHQRGRAARDSRPDTVDDFPENSATSRQVGRYTASDPEGATVTMSLTVGGR